MKQNKYFSIIELSIVIVVMSILAYMLFSAVKASKEATRYQQTDSMMKACKVGIEMVSNFVLNQARQKNLEVNRHPLLTTVWKSNKVWAFRDKEYSIDGITVNGLALMINIGHLNVEDTTISSHLLEYPDGEKCNTLVDGWGNPLLLMRNELSWHVRNLPQGQDVVDKVYRDRKKANLGLYSKYLFVTTGSNMNLYEWNDTSFNHVDSNGVNEPSYEVSPAQANGYKKIQIDGKIAVPHNTDDYDFFSAGKDGKVGNLIKGDMKQDRWSGLINNEQLRWVPTTSSTYDPDTDNIVSFNKYSVE